MAAYDDGAGMSFESALELLQMALGAAPPHMGTACLRGPNTGVRPAVTAASRGDFRQETTREIPLGCHRPAAEVRSC